MLSLKIFDFSNQSDQVAEARVKYLNFLYFMGAIFIPFYLIKDSNIYSGQNKHLLTWPIYTVYLLLPLLSRFKKSFNLISYIAGTISSLILWLVIFQSGGLYATGTFWLTIIPMNFGILLGRRGVFIGGLGLLISLFFLWLLDQMGIQGGVLLSEESRKFDLTVDLVTFTIYALFTTYYFISNEEKSKKNITEQRKSIETLLRTLVHDVAAPVQISDFSLEQIRSNAPNSANYQKAMHRIAKSNALIIEIINQIRQMQSLKDGKYQLNIKEENIYDCIHNVVELLQSKAEQKNIEISFISEGHNLKAKVDATALSTIVLSNLITNSIKFSQPQSKIEVRLSEFNSDLEIAIKDWGIGIPEAILKDIWKINAATSRSGTQGEKGTGYGMPLVKEFINRMSGKIEIESVPDKGTLVKIYLPASKS